MMTTITLHLGEQAASAYAQLKAAGVDPAVLVEKMLVREAARVRHDAEEAADVRRHEVEQTGLDEMRELPTQIEYVRPPR